MDLKVMLCMDSHLEPLLVLMIETPHTVHTHSRSSLYIYKVFEHLKQWLRVIGMSLTPHPRKTLATIEFFVFELKQQSRNYRNVGNPWHVVKCRVFRHSSRHAMSPCRRHKRRHVTDTTRHVCKWRLGKTQQNTTFPAKVVMAYGGRLCRKPQTSV